MSSATEKNRELNVLWIVVMILIAVVGYMFKVVCNYQERLDRSEIVIAELSQSIPKIRVLHQFDMFGDMSDESQVAERLEKVGQFIDQSMDDGVIVLRGESVVAEPRFARVTLDEVQAIEQISNKVMSVLDEADQKYAEKQKEAATKE